MFPTPGEDAFKNEGASGDINENKGARKYGANLARRGLDFFVPSCFGFALQMDLR